jgi:hypothetical protein
VLEDDENLIEPGAVPLPDDPAIETEDFDFDDWEAPSRITSPTPMSEATQFPGTSAAESGELPVDAAVVDNEQQIGTSDYEDEPHPRVVTGYIADSEVVDTAEGSKHPEAAIDVGSGMCIYLRL